MQIKNVFTTGLVLVVLVLCGIIYLQHNKISSYERNIAQLEQAKTQLQAYIDNSKASLEKWRQEVQQQRDNVRQQMELINKGLRNSEAFRNWANQRVPRATDNNASGLYKDSN